MKRPLRFLIGLVVLVALGCQSSQYAGDPFLGRQRVPPPGSTLAPPANVGQPYYQSPPGVSQPGAISPAPLASPYTSQAAPNTGKAIVPGQNEYVATGSAIARRSPVLQARQGAVYLDGPSQGPVSQPANGPVQIAAAQPATQPALQRVSPSEEAIAIVEPDFRNVRPAQSRPVPAMRDVQVTQAAFTQQPQAASVVVPASAEAASSQPNANRPATIPSQVVSAPPAAARPPERFGYTESYSRLQGRLEHLQSSNEWKLRYIPIDGDTDQYGGSVVIANPEVLGALREGDYVVLEGQLESANPDEISFAPPFRVATARSNGG